MNNSSSKQDPFLKKAAEAIPENIAFLAEVCRRARQTKDLRPVLQLVVCLSLFAAIWLLVKYGEGYFQSVHDQSSVPGLQVPQRVPTAQPVPSRISAPTVESNGTAELQVPVTVPTPAPDRINASTVVSPVVANKKPHAASNVDVEQRDKREAVPPPQTVDDTAVPSPRVTLDVSYSEECGPEFGPVSGLRGAISNKFVGQAQSFLHGLHVAVVAGAKSDTQHGLGTAMVAVGYFKVCTHSVVLGACQIHALSCSRTCRFSSQSTQRDNLLDARDAFAETIWIRVRDGATEGDLCAH